MAERSICKCFLVFLGGTLVEILCCMLLGTFLKYSSKLFLFFVWFLVVCLNCYYYWNENWTLIEICFWLFGTSLGSTTLTYFHMISCHHRWKLIDWPKPMNHYSRTMKYLKNLNICDTEYKIWFYWLIDSFNFHSTWHSCHESLMWILFSTLQPVCLLNYSHFLEL